MKANILRRHYEAAVKDRDPDKFFGDFRTAVKKREIRMDAGQCDFGIRPLFENFVQNGREIVDSWNPGRGEGGISLLEAGDAVNTAAFSNITGQFVYNAIMEAFESEGFVFSPLVTTRQTDLSGEKIPGITRMGDRAEVVPEGQPYPHVGVGEDWIETPVTTKRGMIVPLTKEAIFFDRTGLVIQRCGEVGAFLGLNKEKRVIDCIVDENVTAHRYKWRGTIYATYQTTSPWDNVTAGATLVDYTDLDEAEQTLSNILDPNTGEPIVNVATDLIVTRQLLYTARSVLHATQIRVGDGASVSVQTISGNPLAGSAYNIRSSALLAARMATDTTYYLGDLKKAFAYMQNWPLTTVMAPTNSTDEFERDIVMQWKASERGATVVVEPRVITKCTVA
jgi:hypothetical protein